MRLTQVLAVDGRRLVAARDDDGLAREVVGIDSTYALAQLVLAGGQGLVQAIDQRLGEAVDLDLAAAEGRILAPIDHPDSAHLHMTGTGLTHLGSAEGRDKMHKAAAAGAMTDSLRMFLMGVEGGKPSNDETGAQPEWFYKGNGSCMVAPGGALQSPEFAQDGGEEPEIAGIYIIDDSGIPHRLGFALANEFSDHVTERANYLWLAHSKLRPAAIGPELLIGDLPRDISGSCRILRGDEVLWQQSFLTGEANMAHSLANLEYHHFKYDLFRNPGDIHVHFFGTATLSFSDGIVAQEGDVFEIAASPFGLPLRNRLTIAPSREVRVRML